MLGNIGSKRHLDETRAALDATVRTSVDDRQVRYSTAMEILANVTIKTVRDTDEMFYYDKKEGYYKPVKSLLAEEVQRRLGKDATPKAKADILSYIADATRVDREEFDVLGPWRVVKNGILNIETRELKPHSPDFLATVALPAEYRPELGHGIWGQFLEDALDEENRRGFAKMVGDILTPGYPYQMIYFLVGPGGNGKGTAGRGLVAFVGQKQSSGVRLHDLSNDSHATADLVGKLLNFAGDVDAKEIRDWALIRSLSGGDQIRANGKWQKPFFFENSAKLVFAFNRLPEVEDAYSSYRRVVLIQFEHVFSEDERDPDIDSKLQSPEALSCLLNVGLDGVAWLKEDGGYKEGWKETREKYELLQNEVARFINECAIIDHDSKVETWKAYDAYLQWAKKVNKPSMLQNAFGAKLIALGYEKQRSRAKGDKAHYYQGLRLKEYNGL